MKEPRDISLRCISWNIAGKFPLLKLQKLQSFLENFDIVCLSETHSTTLKTVNFPRFKVYEYPDKNCNYEYPRGGICLLVKEEVKMFIKHVKLLMTDFIQVTLTNNNVLEFLYIPPVDSVYYDEQYIELLCSVFVEAKDTPLIAMGDLNARMGDLNIVKSEYIYDKNVDKTVNDNGKHLSQLLFNTSSALPVNHLKYGEMTFDGGFTFERNENQKSEIDWCIANKNSLSSIESFTIKRDAPSLSDHKPIEMVLKVNGKKSLSSLVKAASDLNFEPSNHSRFPKVNQQNTNMKSMERLLQVEVEKLQVENLSSHEIANFLHENIHKCGKIAKLPLAQRSQHTHMSTHNGNLQTQFEKEEEAKWEYVKNCDDMKSLWESINMKGEIKPTAEETSISVNDLAEASSKKSRIDYSQALFEDLDTDVTNTELDREISKEEVEEAVAKAKDSKTSDGIPGSIIRALLPTIINLLIVLFNLLYTGGKDAYPDRWINFVNALPKKGRLQLPKFVRFITVMGIFEKLYQIVISSRLCKFLKIPRQQTAYQSGLGCNLHVFTIRLLKALAAKTKKKLFIVFTDFEAAFDLVSRRLLFKKLIKLGISSVMLTALMAIYSCSKSVVEHDKTYSDYLLLLTGVKQGAPPSGLLYIAYTMGLIDMYESKFHPEPLIYIYHMLVHADDILMLATSRNLAIDKIFALLEYCSESYIKLQITKCAFMCVNSSCEEDQAPIAINDLSLDMTEKEVYLGSVITNSVKFSDDMKADVKHRQISIIKYFAFLRCNRNAPVNVKTIALDACTLSSLLYNAETWACAKIDSLETIYRRMLKSILGIGMTVCNELVYIELGMLSIKTRIKIKQWRFWKTVLEMDEDNPIMYVIKEARKQKMKEVKFYDKLLEKYENVEAIVEEFFDELRTDIRIKAGNGRTKYVTYLLVNPKLTKPAVYDKLKNHNHVSMIGKLRTSSHNLHVETGRRMGKSRDRRLCICENEVEDEEHFLRRCNLYYDIRRAHNITTQTLEEILDDATKTQYIIDLMERRKQMTVS